MMTTTKKSAKNNAAAQPPKMTLKKTAQFFGDVKGELKRISWPNAEELNSYTRIVVGASFVLGFSLYIMDITVHGLVRFFGTLFSWLIG